MIGDEAIGGAKKRRGPKLARGGKNGARTRRIDSVLKLAKEHQDASFKWPTFSIESKKRP